MPVETKPSRHRTVSCPRCGAAVEWRPENRFRPFCSERCKLLDLGAWANEEYRVPVEGMDRGESQPSGDFETRWSPGTKS